MKLRSERCTPSTLQHALFSLVLAHSAACGDDAKPTDENEEAQLPALPDKVWSYQATENTFCRDGSQAGYAISPSSSSKNLMIFLEGGGACFDALSCLANPRSVLPGRELPAQQGIFDRSNPENPVGQWNHVFVPYCTGDVHLGAQPNGTTPDGSPAKFVGYTNLGEILKQLRKRFPEVEHVLLTGVSAGGFGAPGNVPQVMRAFPEAKGHLIDDSGPAMSSKYLASCLQDKWRTTWNLDETLLKECGDDCPNRDDYTLDFSRHLASKHPEQTAGLIESTSDFIITAFFGPGLNDCTGSPLTPIAPAEFKAGLLDFRAQTSDYANFGTYYVESSQHTWLQSGSLYSEKVEGVRLVDWVRAIVDGGDIMHVGPAPSGS